MDGGRYASDTIPDPACGPGTAILALLDPRGTQGWAGADRTALVRFLDRLPEDRRSTFDTRLIARLDSLGESDLLEGLSVLDTTERRGRESPEVVAAGTDDDAVAAATDLLVAATGAGLAAPEEHLVNAMALRTSLPAGDARSALDNAIWQALVISRKPGAAALIVSEGVVDAELVVVFALERLPPVYAAEYAVRLRPHLAPDSVASAKAAEHLSRFGIEDAAAVFRDPARGELPYAAERYASPPNPWLERDMAAVAASAGSEGSSRREIAAEILRQNEFVTPEGDLAAAEAVLAGSRRMAEAIDALMGSATSR